MGVSTHSRPKAAGTGNKRVKQGVHRFQHTAARRRLAVFVVQNHGHDACFNTQPPEGGWCCSFFYQAKCACFNTQPPEGGWALAEEVGNFNRVSTHSRPKAAGFPLRRLVVLQVFQHTAARRRLAGRAAPTEKRYWFQHTAARRRLVWECWRFWIDRVVSTHSRPKAAGSCAVLIKKCTLMFQHTAARRRLGRPQLRQKPTRSSFNTQPPEGGWHSSRL